MIRGYLRTLFFMAAAGGVYLAVRYICPYEGSIALSGLILQLSGSRGEFPAGFHFEALAAFALRLLPHFVFEIYFGIAFYRHFCTGSVYVFSRYPKRVKWYLGQAASLFACSCLFQGLLMAAAVFVTVLRYQVCIDKGSVTIAICHFLIYSFWLYFMAMLINLFSIKFGSGASYSAVMAGWLALVSLICIQKPAEDAAKFGAALAFNPAARLVLGWQTSKNPAVRDALHAPYKGMDIGASVLFFMALAGLAVFIGAVIVKRHDLLVADSERQI